MRIITPGKRPEDELYEGRCTCGCVFECIQRETEYDQTYGASGRVIHCPTCKALVKVKHVPSAESDRVSDRDAR